MAVRSVSIKATVAYLDFLATPFILVHMHNPSQSLATKRFILAIRRHEDLSDLLDLDDDPDVIRYVGPVAPRGERESDWLKVLRTQHERPVLTIRAHETGEFMGWAFLRPYKDDSADWELGYRLKKTAWGQGIGTEVSRALLAWGWAQPDIQTIVAVYETANVASLNIMLKLGMKPMGLRLYPNEGLLPYCALDRPA
jgi:RimJ/RimL family protein N-acetyltransferase